jgi:hypothetical protein
MKIQYFAKVTDFDYSTNAVYGDRLVEVSQQNQADYCIVSENGVNLADVEKYLNSAGNPPPGIQIIGIYKDGSPKSWSMNLFDPS